MVGSGGELHCRSPARVCDMLQQTPMNLTPGCVVMGVTMKETVEPPDEALMARVRDGDEQALDALVRRYEHALFNYARKMLGRAEDAEDVFQEAFVRVYQHRTRYRAGAPFRPWLYRITTNLCRDRLRYRKRRPEVNTSGLARDGAEEDFLSWVPAHGGGPREAAVAGEMAVRMRDALANLHVKHRAVFLMAHQEGMPYAEIAVALRVPVGTVKSRMNKAVSQLLAAMEAME